MIHKTTASDGRTTWHLSESWQRYAADTGTRGDDNTETLADAMRTAKAGEIIRWHASEDYYVPSTVMTFGTFFAPAVLVIDMSAATAALLAGITALAALDTDETHIIVNAADTTREPPQYVFFTAWYAYQQAQHATGLFMADLRGGTYR